LDAIIIDALAIAFKIHNKVHSYFPKAFTFDFALMEQNYYW